MEGLLKRVDMEDKMSINPNDFAAKYAECGNAYEAAVYAGAARGLEAAVQGVKLLTNGTVRNRIAYLRGRRAVCPAEQGLRRIAFGRNNDAVALAFSQEITPELIEQADLYGVSELKVGKGVVEMKFFDRSKALERLAELEASERGRDESLSLIEAIYGREEVDN